MKALLKRVLQKTPYRIVRATARNRFSAQQETLLTLAGRGYRPRRIVDGGANVGDFARLARSVFPAAQIDLIEPQPACQTQLTALVRAVPGHALHAVAIGREAGMLNMALDPNEPSTGAHIFDRPDAMPGTVHAVPVQTLDTILAGITRDDRVFLKLDLQGWELEALHGALTVLPEIEAILVEASFFAQAYEPPIATLIGFLAEQGFVLDDVAALMGRQRDNRAHQADLVFIRADSELNADRGWA